MSATEELVDYRDGDAELCGFLVGGDQTDPRPGVLVVHGGAGLDDHARARARQLAELGLVVFACDMYGKAVTGDRARVVSQIMQFRTDPGKLCRRALAGLQVLAAHPWVNGQIASIGYCFGGMTVLELARHGVELNGVVSIHGTLNTSRRAQPGQVRARILVCHGALDPHVPIGQVSEFIDEMNSAGADWQLIVYGSAMHGFTHEADTETPGVAYHAISDARSSQAIKEFLTEIFGQDSTASTPADEAKRRGRTP